MPTHRPAPDRRGRLAWACRLVVIAVLAALVVPGSAAVGADPSALDQSFAGGRVVMDLGRGDDVAYALAVLDDGRVVVAGRARGPVDDDVVLARLATDGTADTAFGDRGTVLVDLGASDGARALALAGDGSLLVAGRSATGSSDFALLRVSATGVPDRTLAGRGSVRTDLGGDDQARALAAQPDGRLLVAGSSTSDGRTVAALVRYLPGGALDPSFGDGGKVITTFPQRDARALAVALAPDGRIVVAGATGQDAFVAHHLSDGALDASFGDGGRVLLRIADLTAVDAVRIEPDGEVLFAGSSTSDGTTSIVVARVLTAGAPDASFGTNGVQRTAVQGRAVVVAALASDAAGRIVVAGVARERDGDALLLLRLMPDGTPDPAFGRMGVVDIDGPDDHAHAYAVAVQRDGRILVAGAVGGSANRDLLVARLAAGAARCGDAIVDPGESCDDGAHDGGPGSCCGAACGRGPTGDVCRAAAGACDAAETCDGTSPLCPDDALARSGALCRAAAGACDVAEVCSGSAAECPLDDVRHAGTVCRVASGACDLDEQCDGAAPECPQDARSTRECRVARGSCDAAEWCDGVANGCPADVVLPDGSACDDGNACTVDDVCSDASCSAGAHDPLACSGYLCSTITRASRIAGAAPSAADLSRALGDDVAAPRRSSAVCEPAFVGDGSADAAVADAGSGYFTYAVTRATAGRGKQGDTRAGRPRAATIEDQFGSFVADLKAVQVLSLPTAVGRGAGTAVAPPGGAGYRCHGVAARRAPPRREIAVRPGVADTAHRYELREPRRLCQPLAAAGVDGEAPADPGMDDLLLCYLVKLQRAAGEEPPALVPLLAVNPFESWLVEAIGQQHLCVPALLTWAASGEPAAVEPTPRKRKVERAPRPPARKKRSQRRVAE